jgi:hypothetical protein
MSPEKLLSAVRVARESYIVERWWKYGQPAIDLITATINVRDMAAAGQVMGHLAGLQGKGMQVTFEVFPYGIINPDGVRINAQIENQVGGR